jgi:hypothetical protein
MTKYKHSFYVTFPISFESGEREFDDAFDEWANTFKGEEKFREALLNCEDDVKTICSSVDWWATRTITPDETSEVLS